MSQRNSNKGVPVPLIAFAMIIILVVGVMVALFLAPEKEAAPPSSPLSYVEPPAREEVPIPPIEEPVFEPISAPTLEEVPSEEVDASLEEEALPGEVSGTVRDVKSGAPIPDMKIIVEGSDASAVTDNKGKYTIQGLGLGTYGVIARYQQTRYRPSIPLPYQKVTLSEEAIEIGGVDFVLETAGLVWGYVTTQDQKPVPEAEVVLCTSDSFLSQAMQQFMTRSRPIRARADAEGYYELAGVPLNKEWSVYADSQSHAPQLADPFILTASQDSARLDIHMFGGSTVFGKVVDPKGTPIPGADVVCLPAYGELLTSMSTPQGFRDVHTDDNGEFTIPDLAAGDYQLIGRKKGYQVQLSGLPLYSDGQNPLNNVIVEQLPIDKGTHRIVGEVITVAGYPVEGAEVSIEGTSFQLVDPIQQEQLTDSKGRFSFNELPASTYSMEVQAIGYAPKSIPRVLLDKETRVLLSHSGVVQGTVLLRETNAPVEGAMVDALFQNSDKPIESEMRMPSAVTDVSGNFQMSLPEGTWLLEGRATDLTPGRVELTIYSGESIGGIEIYVSASGGSISGEVTTSNDSSPQGANVMLIDFAHANSGAIGGLSPVQSERVGPDGLFAFRNLPAGQYSLIAEHETLANASSGLFLLEDGNTIDDVVLRLGAGGVLQGFVYKNGQPVPDVLVLAANITSATQATARTDAEGFYEILDLASGNYLVTVIGGSSSNPLDILDYEGQSVEVTEGNVSRLDFGTGEGVPLEGIIYPAPTGILGGVAMLRMPGVPPIAPPGATVNLMDLANLSFLYSGNIDFAGQFQFSSVTPGLYQVEIYYAFGLNSNPNYRNVYLGQFEVTGEGSQYLQLNATL